MRKIKAYFFVSVKAGAELLYKVGQAGRWGWSQQGSVLTHYSTTYRSSVEKPCAGNASNNSPMHNQGMNQIKGPCKDMCRSSQVRPVRAIKD